MQKLFWGFALSWSMLTSIPFVRVRNFYEGINGYAVMFYPLVGLILGSMITLFYLLLEGVLPSHYLLVLSFALWILLTGALHLDGVADVCDALFVSKQRRSEVMKDPHIGAMGVIFTLLFIIVKLAAFVQIQAIYLLPLVLMFSRFNAALALYLFAYIRQDGMASLAKKEFRRWQFLVMLVVVASITAMVSYEIVLWMFGLLMLPLLVVTVIAKRLFGGYSGDLYGVLIETSEWVLLHLLIFGVGL